MGKLELCREPVHIEAREVVLGIHSNKAGDQFDYTDGHAWISVSTGTEVYYLGLWPDGHQRVSDHRADCTDVRMGMEAGAIPMVSRYYVITGAKIQKLNEFINTPDMWKVTNTCAAWATRLLSEVVGMHISAIDYAIFSTPRELGKELMYLEKKNPTSPMNPKRGEFPEYPSSMRN